MKLYPALIVGAQQNKTRIYVFGESYGGPYSISLAYRILEKVKSSPDFLSLVNVHGIGLGNALISPRHQFQYSDFMRSVGYMTMEQLDRMKMYEKNITDYIARNQSKEGMAEFIEMFSEFKRELNQSRGFTHGFTNPNVYDITVDNDYLLANEYICYFQDHTILRGIHVGNNSCKRGHKLVCLY